jgi:hypothetical protein
MSSDADTFALVKPIITDPDYRQSDVGYRDAVTSWRLWTTRSDDPTALRNPFLLTDHPLTHHTVLAWCPNPCHDPPEIGCGCGLYAVENVVDALYRLRVTQFNLRTGTTAGAFHPFRPRTIPVLTKGLSYKVRVTNSWTQTPGARRINVPELRAAMYRIERVYIASDACPHWLAGCRFTCRRCPDAARIADALGDALGVHALPNLPTYTDHDWQSRPDWYRCDPDIRAWFACTAAGYFASPKVPFTAPVPKCGQIIPGASVCADVLKVAAQQRKKANR